MNRRWDSQYPSLWVTDGGGGTFLDIWTPSTFGQAGMRVPDTETERRAYQMSSEHHVRNEVPVRNAPDWRIYALQTEAERGESGFCLPLEIDSSRDVTVANFHIYRVISSYQPFPWAAKVSHAQDIRFRNLHCYSEVPERPLQIVFGGLDRRTLFIPARTSLYSVRTRYPCR